jgi:hypothetical protein
MERDTLRYESCRTEGREMTMKIKIIKAAGASASGEMIHGSENGRSKKSDTRKAAETVKHWIEELRLKHERERETLFLLLKNGF